MLFGDVASGAAKTNKFSILSIRRFTADAQEDSLAIGFNSKVFKIMKRTAVA